MPTDVDADSAFSDDHAPPDEADPSPGPSWRARLVVGVEWILIATGVTLLAMQPSWVYGDGAVRFAALSALLSEKTLIEVPYSLIGPIFAAPLWFAGEVLSVPEAWVGQYNMLLFVLGLGALYALLRKKVEHALLRRFLLLLVAASMVAPHTYDFYGEMFTAVAVGVGLVAATGAANRHLRRAGWGVVVLGAASTPASLVGLGLVGVGQSLVWRRLRFLLPVVGGAVLVLGEAWARRGNPFDNGYVDTAAKTVMPYSGDPGFSYPFLLGVASLLFSFGKGIVFYLPGLLLPIRGKLRQIHDPARIDLYQLYRLWMLFVVGLVLVYASWWAWYGGWYWGPRFFLIAILPASLALAVCISYPEASPLANLATIAVLALSVWIGANSLIFGSLTASTCIDDSYALETLCHHTPEFSALWYPFVAEPTLSGKQVLQAGYYILVFFWLAGPVEARLWRQIADWARRAGWPQLAPKNWRW